MSTSEWDGIISAMKAQSGRVVDEEISDAVAAQIQQLTGKEVPAERRRYTRKLPSVDFGPGLLDSEIVAVEKKFGFRFPLDLRAFLQMAIPRGPEFPNWRSGDEATLRDWLDMPRKGVLFDVEHNDFWLREWGIRPESLERALRIASELISSAPRLIPIYSHRMIPDEPHLEGNPVLSIHQTDIIHYGFDLEDYLRHEFNIPGREPWPDQVRLIRFWNVDRFQEVCWTGHAGRRFWNRRRTTRCT